MKLNMIEDLFMQAHAAAAMDSQVDLDGNSHDAWSVIATLNFVFRFYIKTDLPAKPSIEELKAWLIANNRETEIEYLMECY